MFREEFLNLVRDPNFFDFLHDLPLNVVFDGQIMQMVGNRDKHEYCVGKTVYEIDYYAYYNNHYYHDYSNTYKSVKSYRVRSEKYYHLWIIIKFNYTSFPHEFYITSEVQEDIEYVISTPNFIEQKHKITVSEIKLFKEKLKDNPGLLDFI